MSEKIKSVQEQLFVDKLANVIRRADGDHTMGAGALADAIADSGILFELEEAARAEGWEEGKLDYIRYYRSGSDSGYPQNPYN